jgi:hypothetical protein
LRAAACCIVNITEHIEQKRRNHILPMHKFNQAAV